MIFAGACRSCLGCPEDEATEHPVTAAVDLWLCSDPCTDTTPCLWCGNGLFPIFLVVISSLSWQTIVLNAEIDQEDPPDPFLCCRDLEADPFERDETSAGEKTTKTTAQNALVSSVSQWFMG